MRTEFINTLTRMAERDPRVTLMTGDLGFGVVQKFAERFPDQFLNVGVAEQNMTGLAAGAAMSGRIVFTYSIANFPTLRPLEQIRNDVAYHGANVVVVAVGGGMAYGALGASHHATEDLAVLRSLPGMTVIAPGDPVETTAAVEACCAGVGPCYLRLGRAGEPLVHEQPIDWRLGKAIVTREGDDATLISTGGMLHTAMQVAQRLSAEQSIELRVLSMHTLKPLDERAIATAAADTGAVFTLEEHSVIGGLGGAAAETLAENTDTPCVFKRFGLTSEFLREVGDQQHLIAAAGLDEETVSGRIAAALATSPAARLAA
ncbi:MAG: transketolase C-terminal domain-containing protein [Planctomycetota bacterium]